MTVNVINRQHTYQINNKWIAAVMKKFQDHLGLGAAEVTVLLVNNPAMLRFNSHYRQLHRSTDVLSFPQYEGTPETVMKAIREDQAKGCHILLGDIVISLETLWKRCRQNHPLFLRDFVETAAHAMLHLSGYDHDADDAKREMDQTTQCLVQLIEPPRLSD